MIYLLDTNVIADRMRSVSNVSRRPEDALRSEDHKLCICQPIMYEIRRGLLKTDATRKLKVFEEQIIPLLTQLPLEDEDWRQAAVFWADTQNTGKQLADVDLLLAAITIRVNGVLVSADNDFDALPVRRENWREPIETDDNS